jgi:predicted dehydrogenase
LHASTIAGLGEASLVGIVDRLPAALAAAAEQFPTVPRWNDLSQAIEQCEAEAWIVASSTAAHIPIATALLAAGHSVLIEKPLAGNRGDAESLMPLVASDSSNVMLAHIVLFNSEFRQLREEVRQRGRFTYIDCVRHRPTRTIQAFPGENPLYLTMVHDLYCLLALNEGAEPVAFNARLHRDGDGAIDLAVAQLRWPDGALASLTASFLTPPGMPDDGYDRTEVFGNTWAARTRSNPRPLELWDDDARWPMSLEISHVSGTPTGMLAEELRAFCRVVRGERQVPLGARYADGLQVLRWLEMLEASATTMQEVPNRC